MRILRYTIPVDDQVHEYYLHGLPIKVAICEKDVHNVEFWVLDRGQELINTPFNLKVVGTGQEIFKGSLYVGTTERDIETGLVWHLIECSLALSP